MKISFDNIHGNTPIKDISGLKDKSIKTQNQLNEAEYNNNIKVYPKYLAGRPSIRRAPFNLGWLKRLHKEMFGEVWVWAGKIRNVELNLGYCSKAYQIETEIKNLLDDLKAWQENQMNILEQTARLHHRTVKIHPFINGNGRWARMLANIWLKQNREPVTHWPYSQMIQANHELRIEYLKAIQEADNGDYTKLIELHTKCKMSSQ